MTNRELFLKALSMVGGRKGELAKRCDVSAQTISKWSAGELSDFARAKLMAITESSGGEN